MGFKKPYKAAFKKMEQAAATPLQDTYAARHLPNGKLTMFGAKMYIKELAEKARREKTTRGFGE